MDRRSLAPCIISLLMLSTLATPVSAETYDLDPYLYEIDILDFGLNYSGDPHPPVQRVAFELVPGQSQEWSEFHVTYTRNQMNETGAIATQACELTTTADSILMVPNENAGWIENITITARYRNLGSTWDIWTVHLGALYHEEYAYRFSSDGSALEWDQTIDTDYWRPVDSSRFYQDQDRLDHVVAKYTNSTDYPNDTEYRAACYAWTTTMGDRLDEVIERLDDYAHTDPASYLYANGSVTWASYATNQALMAQAYAQAGNLTEMLNHTYETWLAYEISSYLELASYWQQYGFTEGVSWAMDYAEQLYTTEYGGLERPGPAPVPVDLTLYMEVGLIGGGMALVTIAMIMRRPILYFAGLALIGGATAYWLGWL